MNPKPVVLEGTHVRLVPLAREHAAAVAEVAFDPSIWQWTTLRLETRADVEKWIDDALAGAAKSGDVPFVTTLRESGKVVGSTRYIRVDGKNRALEIGYTWIAPAWQRTAVNTEAKLLMLRHAFDELGAERVELVTDALNVRSRTAIARIGGQLEGVLRSHIYTQGGRRRDTAVFSIVRAEWARCAQELERRVAGYSGGPSSSPSGSSGPGSGSTHG